MNLEDFKITSGINSHQNASIERNEKTIDYSSSKPLSYADILSITKGLNVISEIFDVNAVVTVSGTNISAVALGKSLEEAIVQAMDSNPLDFVNANVVVSAEIDSDAAKMLKGVNIIIAPKFTKNAVEYLDSHDICYVSIETPLKDYKKYLSNETIVTPLGTLVQTPNLSELDKETFIRFHIPPKETKGIPSRMASIFPLIKSGGRLQGHQYPFLLPSRTGTDPSVTELILIDP